jgi:hypothetical protein
MINYLWAPPSALLTRSGAWKVSLLIGQISANPSTPAHRSELSMIGVSERHGLARFDDFDDDVA